MSDLSRQASHKTSKLFLQLVLYTSFCVTYYTVLSSSLLRAHIDISKSTRTPSGERVTKHLHDLSQQHALPNYSVGISRSVNLYQTLISPESFKVELVVAWSFGFHDCFSFLTQFYRRYPLNADSIRTSKNVINV